MNDILGVDLNDPREDILYMVVLNKNEYELFSVGSGWKDKKLKDFLALKYANVSIWELGTKFPPKTVFKKLCKI